MALVIKKISGSGYTPKSTGNGWLPWCLLLTATIAPPQAAVARYDSQLRLNDYLDALRFYLSLPVETIDRVLFVDNSASDITPIANLARQLPHDKLVEIISFHGNDHPVDYGKAYGEFRLMDFGLEHTSLLADDDIFWKVTGRLKFANLHNMIAAITGSYEVLCDLHNFPLIGTGKFFDNRWMELRVFSCSVKAYKKLFAGKYEQYGARINQDVLYDVVMDASERMNIRPRFPIQPILKGASGRHDRDYHDGLQKFKTQIRAGARKIVPFVWV